MAAPTDTQNAIADALLGALTLSADLVPDTCEGSEGHLRDEAYLSARTDLEYIRRDPTSPILALEDGGYLAIEDWLTEAAAMLARWHEQADPHVHDHRPALQRRTTRSARSHRRASSTPDRGHVMTLLQRARTYRDLYRIRRQRHTPPLDTQLRSMLRLNVAGATLNPDDTLDRIADVMHGHPDVVAVEVDCGAVDMMAGSGTYGFALAFDHGGNLLARVDVDPDGTLTLIPDNGGRS